MTPTAQTTAPDERPQHNRREHEYERGDRNLCMG